MFSRGLLRKGFIFNSISSKYGYSKILVQNMRLCTTQVIREEKNPTIQWYPFYKFPLIRLVAAMNKLKIYAAGLTGMGVPACFALEQIVNMPTGVPMIAAAIGKHKTFNKICAEGN